jgi:hypothetical protein
VDDETRPASAAVRPTVQLLTAPSGFTLAAGGVLAVIIGRHGYPGILPIWLFVAGGCAAFCLTALMSKANGAQSPHARPAADRVAAMNWPRTAQMSTAKVFLLLVHPEETSDR